MVVLLLLDQFHASTSCATHACRVPGGGRLHDAGPASERCQVQHTLLHSVRDNVCWPDLFPILEQAWETDTHGGWRPRRRPNGNQHDPRFVPTRPHTRLWNRPNPN